jgi:FMN reductase
MLFLYRLKDASPFCVLKKNTRIGANEMSNQKVNVAIIVGTPNKHSRLQGLIQIVDERLRTTGNVTLNYVHAAELPPEDLIDARFDSPEVIQANKKVVEADAVVIASPVYKASYSGILKAYLDLLPQKGLSGKPVLPLVIGGTISHLLAIDYALKPVLSALGARNILGGVYAVDSWVTRTEQGGFELTEELKARLEASAEELLQEALLRAQSSRLQINV